MIVSADRFPACLAFLWRGDTDGQPLHLDPNDRGGATAYGITLATYSAWRTAHGIARTTSADLAAASSMDLAALVRAWFWMPPRCDGLPAGLDLMALDIAFGSGPGVSARMLQRAAGVVADGNVGPVTLAAVARNPVVQMIEAMHAGWLAYCRGISEPGGWATYANGWTNRANKRLAAAMGMAGVVMPKVGSVAPLRAVIVETPSTDELNAASLKRAGG